MSNFLAGYRTYLTAALFILANVLHWFGILDTETIQKIDVILGGLGLAFLRMGVAASKNP